MQASAHQSFVSTVSPLLDRSILQLEEKREWCKFKFSVLWKFACIWLIAGLVLLLIGIGILGNEDIILLAVIVAYLCIAGVLAFSAGVMQTNYILKNKPLQLYRSVRAGLLNVGFVYGNHRVFFAKFWVFHEMEGGRIAIANMSDPLHPQVFSNGAPITLLLDGKISFVGRVSEKQPQLVDFFVHPDFRYRKKQEIIYETANLSIRAENEPAFQHAFPFGNGNRRQFLAFVSYICN